MTDSARHLEHFLEGSGEPIIYNRDQARSFGPVRRAKEHAQANFASAIAERLRNFPDGEDHALDVNVEGAHGSASHANELVRGILGQGKLLNDNLASGRTAVDAGFSGSAIRRGNEIIVKGTVDHSWNDRYDFEPTKGLRVPQPGADAATALQKYRGARRFDVRSDWRQRVEGTLLLERGRWVPRLEFRDLD